MDADRLVGGEAVKPRSQQHIALRCRQGRCQIPPLLPVLKGLPEALYMATCGLKSTSNQSPSAKGVAQSSMKFQSSALHAPKYAPNFCQLCRPQHLRRPPAMFPSPPWAFQQNQIEVHFKWVSSIPGNGSNVTTM